MAINGIDFFMNQSEIYETFAEFYDDPLGFVMFMYPWDNDPAIQRVKLPDKYKERFDSEWGPDTWACEYLEELGDYIRERDFVGKSQEQGETSVDPIQFSTVSGHGIGKSTLVAWIVIFLMCTRPLCKGTITATTETQLRTRTWAEVGKWLRRSFAKDMFEYTTGRGSMSLYHPEYKTEWFVQAITCREENSEAFAGQHAANSTSFYIFDEASGVPDKIWEVRDGGLTDGEPMTFDFGNGTRNTGRFYENMEGRFRHRFVRRNIDSRDVAITNKAFFKRMVEDHGEESDYVKVRCRGMFPSVGSMQFMPTDLVRQAMAAPDLRDDPTAPLVFGIDVARYGDDETVVYPRLGLDMRNYKPLRIREANTIYIAEQTSEYVDRFRRDGIEYSQIFVDSTGGYGGGVADQLRAMGLKCVEINFGNKSPDFRYRYYSDYMWGRLRDALDRGAILPRLGGNLDFTAADSDLEADAGLIHDELAQDIFTQLTGRQFSYTIQGNKIHLEPKADMKERIGSPDLVDAMALTFAMNVQPRRLSSARSSSNTFAQHEYDPYSMEDF